MSRSDARIAFCPVTHNNKFTVVIYVGSDSKILGPNEAEELNTIDRIYQYWGTTKPVGTQEM